MQYTLINFYPFDSIQILYSYLFWIFYPKNILIGFLCVSFWSSISFIYLKNQFILNLADKSEPKDSAVPGEGENPQPNVPEKANDSSTGNSGAGPSTGGQQGEQPGGGQDNPNPNENPVGQQGHPDQPIQDEPTPGEQIGLDAFEEGVLTNSINRDFKRSNRIRRGGRR